MERTIGWNSNSWGSTVLTYLLVNQLQDLHPWVNANLEDDQHSHLENEVSGPSENSPS